MTHRIILLSAFSALLAGCGGAALPSKTGAVFFSASLHSKLIHRQLGNPPQIDRVAVSLRCGSADPVSHDLSLVGAAWQGIFGELPVGTCDFHADAYNANGLAFSGDDLGVVIVADQSAAVSLTLEDQSPAAAFDNSAPIIDALTASSNAVKPGATVALTVTAHDPDAGDSLTYFWSAPGGSFSPTDQPSATWTAPSTEGPQTLTIMVTDSLGAMTALSITVDVSSSHGRGQADVSIVSFNSWPAVDGLTASPTLIDVGATTTLSLNASDADGDPLTYVWSSDCQGSFSYPDSQLDPQFTLSAIPDNGTCTLSVLLTDGHGGHNSGSIDLFTGPNPSAMLAAVIYSSFQSTTTATGGAEVDLGVTADAPGNPLTFIWTADVRGQFVNQVDSAEALSSSDVRWIAPDCSTGWQNAVITLTAYAAGVPPTTETFTVQSSCPALPSDLTGTYSGAYYVAGQEGALTLDLTQVGTSVQGIFDTLLGEGALSGTWDGQTLSGTLDVNVAGTDYTFSLSAEERTGPLVGTLHSDTLGEGGFVVRLQP